MAAMVPMGIDDLGSSRSPDICTPAVKPVTAGKKMPKSTISDAPFGSGASTGPALLTPGSPKKIEASESRMAARIKYCILIASEVLTSTIPEIARTARVP